jgi:hypothetical protein
MNKFDDIVTAAIMAGVEPEEARRRATIATSQPRAIEDMTTEELLQSLRDMPAEAFEQDTALTPEQDLRTAFEAMPEEEVAACNERYGLTPEVLAMSAEEQSAYWADQKAEKARVDTATKARQAAVAALIASGSSPESAERSVADVKAFMPEKKGPSEQDKLRAQLRQASRSDMGLPENDDAAEAAEKARAALDVERSYAR